MDECRVSLKTQFFKAFEAKLSLSRGYLSSCNLILKKRSQEFKINLNRENKYLYLSHGVCHYHRNHHQHMNEWFVELFVLECDHIIHFMCNQINTEEIVLQEMACSHEQKKIHNRTETCKTKLKNLEFVSDDYMESEQRRRFTISSTFKRRMKKHEIWRSFIQSIFLVLIQQPVEWAVNRFLDHHHHLSFIT